MILWMAIILLHYDSLYNQTIEDKPWNADALFNGGVSNKKLILVFLLWKIQYIIEGHLQI